MHATRIRSILGLAAAIAALAAGTVQAAEMTVYKQPNYTGQQLTLRGDANSLAGAGFEDQISSIVVRSGRWQVCSQPDFKGDCVVLARGEYPQLAQDMNHRIESAREIGNVAENGFANRRFAEAEPGFARGYRRGGAVELFPGPDFRGRSVWVDHSVPEVNDRLLDRGISSIVVHGGRWQACTRPGFEGRCEVLEPGSYADLGRMDNRIGSLRRLG
jgi:hypothetical protein